MTTPAAATLTIRHDHEGGTRLEGSTRGDGAYEILRSLGWTWRDWAGIHIRGTRDDWAWPSRLERHADALRAAGFVVAVEVDNTWRPAAVRWAEREERAEDRAERLGDRADRVAGRAEALRASADAEIAGRPPGQPLLVDHYSYGREVRRQERHDRKMHASFDAAKYAVAVAEQARGVVRNEVAKHGARAMTRRVEGLEAAARKYRRQLADCSPGEWADITPLIVARTDEEVAFLRAVLDERAASGEFVAWGPDHFRKGDEVHVCGRWLPVRRVNRKSVSVPGAFGFAMTGNDASWSETVTWDKVFGRRRDGRQLDTPNGDERPVGG